MKKIIFVLNLIIVTYLYAQPTNDECANAIELTLQTIDNVNYTTGNLGNATESTPACSGSTSTDVWYSFTATSKANKIYLPPHSGLDLAFELYDACGGSPIICVDNNGTSVSESYYDYHFTIGQTYYIKVFLYNQSFSDAPFEIAVISIPQPENDDCNSSIELTSIGVNDTVSVSGNFGGATESGSPCSGNYATDLWYSFTATTTATKIYMPAHSGLDLTFELYDACGGSPIICVDNNGASVSEYYYNYNFIIGQTYYIRAYLYNQFSADAPFELNVISIAQPENDECSTSIEIPVQGVDDPMYISGNIGGATESLSPCTGNKATDVWFYFTATSSKARIYVDAEAYFNPVIEVFDDCGGNSIACINNNGLNYSEAYYDTNYISGHQYYIRVFGYNQFSSNKEFRITVTDSSIVTKVNDKREDNDLKLYPNPTSKKLIIENGNNYNRIQIISITGIIVLEYNTNEEITTIDVSNLKQGIYNVIAHNDNNNKQLIKRIIIK